MLCGRSLPLRLDPLVDSLFEQVQRQRPVVDQALWNLRMSNFVPSALLALARNSLIFSSPSLYAERLPRPDDVAVDFRDDEALGEAAVLFHVIDGLFAGPAQRVHAGVDDQAAGAVDLAVEPAELRVRVFVEPQVFAQAFGIKRPAFDIGVVQGHSCGNRASP